jgi:anti-sigma-K factor RskA
MNRSSEVHELLAPYALGVLEGDEQRSFEDHLDSCATCRELLPSLLDTSAALALATPRADPSPALRRRILAGARSEVTAERAPRKPWRRPALVPALGTLAAVAACAAVGLGIWVALLHGSLSDERSARTAEDAALAVLVDPSARRVPTSGREGILAVRPDGRAALALHRLAAAPSGQTYEAWVIAAGAPSAAGLFGGGEKAATLVALERRVPRGAVVAVTVERAGGVRRPTKAPIVTAQS